MTEIGIQVDRTLETWRQKPSVLRRPVARRPRVKARPRRKDSTLKTEQERDHQQEEKTDTHSNTESVKEKKNGGINGSLNLEEGIVPFNENDDKKNEKAAILQKLRRSDSQEIRKTRGRVSGVHDQNIKNILKDEKNQSDSHDIPVEKKAASEKQFENNVKQPKIRSKTFRPILARRRAASFDDAYRRKMSDNHSFIIPAGSHFSPEENVDAGSQIMNSYSNKLGYVDKTSKNPKKRPVRNFFRRLAGSLESLLKIKRKPKHSNPFASRERVHPPYNNPLFANYSPYVTVDDCVDSPLVENISGNKSGETRMLRDSSPLYSSREDNLVTAPSPRKTSKLKSSDSKRIAFSRGKRVYLSPGMKNETEEKRFYPVPPQISSRKKSNPVRRTKLHNSFTSPDHKSDWETRSETGSESFVFKSNNLRQADVHFSASSESEDEDRGNETTIMKVIPQNSGEIEFAASESNHLEFTGNKEQNANVNIADFFPKCDTIKQTTLHPPGRRTASRSTSRSRSRSNSRRRTVKDQLPVDSLPPPERTASVGKFDANTPVNGMRRKPRRRNSSFVPNKRASNKQALTETGLKQAPSFEQLINGLQEVVNNLGQVATDSHQSLNTSNATINEQSSNKIQSKRVSPKRNESWVGTFSSRLDKIIDEKSSKENFNKRKVEDKTSTNTTREHRSRTSGRKRNKKFEKRPSVRKSVVKCEKISFDDLEKDFQNFAHEIRQRQSSDKINTIGS